MSDYHVKANVLAALKEHLSNALKSLKGTRRRGTNSSLESSSFAQMVALCDLDDVSRYIVNTCCSVCQFLRLL